MRTSAAQFQLLVEFMERNGDLSKPTEGPQGRAANLKLWLELVRLLNADATGDTKSTEKWRKVWSDLKNNTKKKSARIHRAAQGTGGGPASNIKLSDVEQRVLSIMGTQAATGIIQIPEVGLEVLMEEVAETHDSPSIFEIQEQLVLQTCSDFEDLVGREEPETVNSPALPVVDRSETGLTHGSEHIITEPVVTATAPPAASTTEHAPQSPTPLPPTPRRQRRRPVQHNSSPLHRRTRTQTQSDLARQAFVRADCEWRAFQQEVERERIRLRHSELRMQERWLELFGQFIVLGNRVVDVLEKK